MVHFENKGFVQKALRPAKEQGDEQVSPFLAFSFPCLLRLCDLVAKYKC